MPIENLEQLHEDNEEIVDVNNNGNQEENQENSEENSENQENNDELEHPDDVEISGMEKFLSDYGIVGGMIQFEEGEEKHFDTLTEAEKYNVIASLVEKNSVPLEEKYGLEAEEINLLNYFREQNKPIQESLDELINSRLQQLLDLQQTNTNDFESMSSDAVYLKWLKENNPEATEDELTSDLEAAKQMKTFEKTVTGIKQVFIDKQAAEIREQKEAERQAELVELENDRKLIVENVAQIKEVAGFTVDDVEKNEILSSILEVNEHGDSLFLEEVFSDPNKLFKAAYLYKNGEKLLDEMAAYYKKEMTKQYRKGKEDAMSGAPRKPFETTQTGENKKIENREFTNAKTLEDLHND